MQQGRGVIHAFAGGIVGSVALAAGVVAQGAGPGRSAGLTVHEWGTFTSVAGPDGRAVEWAPLDGPQDLPCFVSELNPAQVKYELDWATLTPASGSADVPVVSWLSTLRATVRMETPVVYFYSDRERTLSVRVDFPQGVITEWYPQAQAPSVPRFIDFSTINGRIAWNAVKVLPNTRATFPSDESGSHYYAARETDANPVEVAGQREKFLFYRGLAGFPVPLSATLTADGRLAIAKTGTSPVGAALLIQNHSGRIGYRQIASLSHPAIIEMPSLTNDLASLRTDLERLLVGQGLFPREAAAMVATWRDSWFEEGTRVIYLWPQGAVDARLPIDIQPAPAQLSRVFVGRVEVITPEDEQSVAAAIARQDWPTLEARGRWLEPIARRILASATPAVTAAQVQTALRAVGAMAVHESTCR
jgi:hypothetical protein